jgi:hypothetical protein
LRDRRLRAAVLSFGALGATDRTILLLLLGQGGRQLGIGVVIALPLTLAVG